MRQAKQRFFYQRGISMYGWMIILALIGFFSLLGMRCIPVYLKHYEVQSVVQWAAQQPELAKASPKAIQSRIQKRFDSGYVYHLTAREIKVKRTKDGRRFLELKYDRQVPFVYNIELLFHFHTVAYLRPAN